MKYLFALLLTGFCKITFAQKLTLEYDPDQFVDHVGTYIKDEQLGGISGLEYVQQRNKWYMITDGKGTARQSYLFEIEGSGKNAFPDWNNLRGLAIRPLANVAYAEAIRFNGTALWVSTEEEAKNSGDPDVKEHGKIAKLDDINWQADTAAYFYETKSDNRGIEAICFTADNKLASVTEWPLDKDGNFARLKLMNYTDSTTELTGAYAYPLDIKSCLFPAQLANGTSGNGITDILPISKNRFLVLERCYNNEKTSGCSVKLFEVQIEKQTTNLGVLEGKPLEFAGNIQPLIKKEIFDFSAITNLKIDNLEGMTWGPDRKSIVFISDNNYQKKTEIQKTQWIVLRVVSGL